MISYSHSPKETIPTSAIKIIGLGGAGANMLEQIALDDTQCGELLALNTDIRTLEASLAKNKIQLGINLTKGLGTGGDPELGQQAILEAEKEFRAAIKGQRIVFLCIGLGGGTGSGAAPTIARLAREEGAFVVVFATMPFFFEGRRRREQAETALNQLAVLSHALVTFDNNRMGELVLAKQGIHEAFESADKMISESIKAVIRLVIRPGLINIGLDDLMSALRTTRSRCLFGSGLADGKDRATKALNNALSSPLLNQGSLLNQAQTVLVHLSGGESLTLFEIEILMESIQKHIPESAHILFGAAIDPSMGESLSITLISALPEDELQQTDKDIPDKELKSKPEILSTTAVEVEQRNYNVKSEMHEVSNLEIAEIVEVKDSFLIHEDGFNQPKQDLPQPPSPMPIDTVISELKSVSLANKDNEIKEILIEQASPQIKPDTQSGIDISDKEQLNARKSLTDIQAQNLQTEYSSTPTISSKANAPSTKLQPELSFDNAPKGRFEGENPNVYEGEDLDLPPFLRKKSLKS